MNESTAPLPPSKLLAYLRLMRLPNVFTALADVVMGFTVMNGGIQPVAPFACLLATTAMLYTAGMVLNDVYDIEVDRRERPRRPLPSGQIAWSWARGLGYLLLFGGLAAAWSAGFIDPRTDVLRWKSGAVATLLALCIWGYDAVLKQTLIGPIAMGACRFFNVLMAMSLTPDSTWSYPPAVFAIAGGIAIYIVGVTYFARTEATESNRQALALATFVIIVGLGVLASFVHWEGITTRSSYVANYHFIVLILALPIIRRCLMAISNPSPPMVQSTIKNCIFSLIILDASVALTIAGPAYGLAIIALGLPMYLLGRWVYST